MVSLLRVIATFRAIAICAIFLSLSFSGAHAQSFEQLTRDGQEAFKRNDYQRALDTRLKQLSMHAPSQQDHCFVYWGLFTAHLYGTGEMEKALKAVDDSIACLNAISDSSEDMAEFRVEAWRYRALALRDWGRYDEALAAVDQMVKIQPSHAADFDSTRGNMLDAKGDYQGAADAYVRAARSKRNGAYLITQSIWMKVKLGKLDEALADLTAAERAKPRSPGNDSNTRAWILAELGRYDDAVADLKADERAGGGGALAYAYLRGYIEAARGNFTEAAAVFKRGAAANGNNANLLTPAYLAQARAGSGNLGDISAIAAKLSPAKWPDSQLLYAAGLIDRNQFEATAKFGNLRIENNRICRVSLVIGEMALISGDKPAAKDALTRAVSKCSFDPGAQERTWALGELTRLDVTNPVAAPAKAAPVVPTTSPTADSNDACAVAAVHWTSAESIGTRAAFEDHLKRFPNCAFATLAAARIAALGQPAPSYTPPAPSAALRPGCKPGYARDSEGDCVREKAAAKPAPRRTTSRAAPEGESGGRAALDCTTPGGFIACANRALSTLPLSNAQ